MYIEGRPFRNLNTDKHQQDVSEGDYLAASGISLYSPFARQNGVITPMLGSKIAFSAQTISAQNKIIQISITDLALPKSFDVVRNTNLIPFFKRITFTTALELKELLELESFAAGYFMSCNVVGNTVTIEPVNNFNPGMRFYDYEIVAASEGFTITTIQESYDVGVAGPMKGFSGTYFQGKQYRASVSKWRPQYDLEVVLVTTSTGQVIVLTTGHQLVTGQEVFCKGFISLPEANGRWIVEVLSDFQFILIAAVPSGGVFTPGQGVVTVNANTVGELGVSERRSNGTWSYTSLGRAKRFNWRADKKVNIDVENYSGRFRIYLSGDNNPPRRIQVFKLTSNEMFDVNENIYLYESFDDQIRLQVVAATAEVTGVQQNNSGGALASGNYRFVVRGKNSDNNASPWGPLSMPVSVFDASIEGDVAAIHGDDEGIITGKSILLNITSVRDDLYSEIEVGAINYLSLSLNPVIISQIKVIPGKTSYELLYTGNGVEINTFDAVTVNIEPSVFSKNEAQAIVDNRLFLGNNYYQGDENVSEVFKNVRYRLRNDLIGAQGFFNELRYGGYQDNANISMKASWMFYETQRVGFRLRYRNGSGYTKTFYFSDIRIDHSPTSADGKREGGITFFTTNDRGLPDSLASIYIDFRGFDLNALINGRPAKDLFDRIEVMIGQMSAPTVLAHGLVVRHFKIGGENGSRVQYITTSSPPVQVAAEVLDFGIPIGGVSLPQPYPGQGGFAYNAQAAFHDKKRVSFFSPDIQSSLVNIEFQPGDKLIVLGDYAGETSPANIFVSSLLARSGVRALPTAMWQQQVQELTVKDVNQVDSSESNIVDVDDVRLAKRWGFSTNIFQTTGFNYDLLGIPAGPVITFEEDYVPDAQNSPFGNPDSIGAGYAIYYRPNQGQYPVDVANTIYESSGFYLGIELDTESPTVYGTLRCYGNTFVCPVYQKVLFIKAPIVASAFPNALNLYIQSRANWNMRYIQENGPLNEIPLTYPWEGVSLGDYMVQPFEDRIFYNRGYNLRNELQFKKAFDQEEPDQSHRPYEIAYSDINVQMADVDGYRNFYELNVRSLDSNYGEIKNLFNINGILISKQFGAISREYVNTYDTESTDSGIEQYVGSGKVLSRPGDPISTYGGTGKWAFGIGKSAGGDDMLMYFDDVKRVFVRFGADGTVPVSEEKMFSAEVYQLAKLARFADAPAAGNGVHVVYNKVLGEFIFVFRCRQKENGLWQSNFTYKEGQTVIVDNVFNNDFENTPKLFVCIQEHDSLPDIAPNRPGGQQYWQAPELSDESFYTKKAISIGKNGGYSHDVPFVTNLMLLVDETYLVDSPSLESSSVFEANVEPHLTFFKEGLLGLEVDGFITIVFNAMPGAQKLWESVIFQCDNVPYKVACKTKNNTRTIFQQEFEQMGDRYQAPLGNDDTIGPDEDTSPLYGEYMECSFFFEKGKFNRLTKVFAKFTEMNRKLGT